jgi:RNA-directed DNA polymerase
MSLADGQRQKIQNEQLVLAFMTESGGEAPRAAHKGTEPFAASDDLESPARDDGLMAQICVRENLLTAWQRVRANGGSAGVDGRSIDDTAVYLQEHWPKIRDQVLQGTFQPQPVKRVKLPKPGGGFRNLGIPTILDRLIQQAILQVLQPQWDPTFSEYSFGFRPGRSAHQAIVQAQSYVAEGYGWTVDIDLEKFFDQVNQDRVMGRAAKRISDKRLLKLLRAFLRAGVMENGLVSPTTAGTAQGSPLSPLLSNLILDELDQELTRRGLRFCRYADDCNIYVRSPRAGKRVMSSISRFLTKRLRLKINASKSAVAPVGERSFLGFCIIADQKPRRHIAPEALQQFKARVRRLTRRTQGVDLPRMIAPLATYMHGWRAYFGFCQTPEVLHQLDAWIRRRLRMVLWKQWRRGPNRFAQLRKRGVSKRHAAIAAGAKSGYWRMSRHLTVQQALPNGYFFALGLPRLESAYRA